MEIWRATNASTSQASDYRALCAQENGLLTEISEGNGRMTFVCSIPNGPPATNISTITNSGGLPNTSSAGVSAGLNSDDVIIVTDVDLEALQRVAESEVGHFAKYGMDELRGGLAAVVDTVFNRVAHIRFPDTIEEVIDQPFQFSAINNVGSWEGLKPATAAKAAIIERHIADRAAGAPSEIQGATHFLNPHISSASAVASWGQYVRDNAIAVYGNDAKQDVHYHGFAPGYKQPDPFHIEYKGKSASFGTSGTSTTGAVTRKALRENLIEQANKQLAYFDNGSAKESDEPHYKRVGEFWDVLGINYDGRTRITDATGKTSNPPWSSAFISALFKWSGAADFPVSQAHCHYFQEFIGSGIGARFEALAPDVMAVQPGDLVHFGRSSAKQFTFSEASAHYIADSFYASHSDIVVSVDRASGCITTVGGNVSNSVKAKTFEIDSDGLLKPRRESGQVYPWIGILRIRS